MARDNPVSRRTALKLTGAAASTALVAGCSGGNGDGNGNGNGNGDDETVTIEPDSTIMFSADGQTWVGSEPSGIADMENPTIELTDGASYTIGWEQNETGHNIALYNSDESVYDGNSTEIASSTGEGQEFDFTASTDIAEYVCEPHYPGMAGTIEVTEGSSDGGSGNESNESSE